MQTRCQQAAAEFFDHVTAAVVSVTEEDLTEELKLRAAVSAELGEPQTEHPLEVLAEMIHHQLGDTGLFRRVRGTLGGWPHSWYEMTIIDKEVDPLPLRWVVDPVPIGSFGRPVGFPPNSPFLALYYIKEVDR